MCGERVEKQDISHCLFWTDPYTCDNYRAIWIRALLIIITYITFVACDRRKTWFTYVKTQWPSTFGFRQAAWSLHLIHISLCVYIAKYYSKVYINIWILRAVIKSLCIWVINLCYKYNFELFHISCVTTKVSFFCFNIIITLKIYLFLRYFSVRYIYYIYLK